MEHSGGVGASHPGVTVSQHPEPLQEVETGGPALQQRIEAAERARNAVLELIVQVQRVPGGGAAAVRATGTL